MSNACEITLHYRGISICSSIRKCGDFYCTILPAQLSHEIYFSGTVDRITYRGFHSSRRCCTHTFPKVQIFYTRYRRSLLLSPATFPFESHCKTISRMFSPPLSPSVSVPRDFLLYKRPNEKFITERIGRDWKAPNRRVKNFICATLARDASCSNTGVNKYREFRINILCQQVATWYILSAAFGTCRFVFFANTRRSLPRQENGTRRKISRIRGSWPIRRRARQDPRVSQPHRTAQDSRFGRARGEGYLSWLKVMSRPLQSVLAREGGLCFELWDIDHGKSTSTTSFVFFTTGLPAGCSSIPRLHHE